MKKLKNLFVLLLALMLIIPVGVVRAEEDEVPETIATELPDNEPVKVYLFHGNGCPHCEETIEWFDSIEEEYGKYFDLVKYEVWYDEDNQKLLQQVGEVMGDEVGGVPYIVVGDFTYPDGFSPDTEIDENGTTMADDMLSKIMYVYTQDEDKRFDVIKKVNDKPNYDNVVAVVSVLVIAGIVALTVVTRRNNKD